MTLKEITSLIDDQVLYFDYWEEPGIAIWRNEHRPFYRAKMLGEDFPKTLTRNELRQYSEWSKVKNPIQPKLY